LSQDAPNPWYEVTLTEGRNRQLHRMFEAIGHHVEKIKRIRYGPLELDLELGKFRKLSEREIALLKRAAGSGATLGGKASDSGPRKRSRS